MTRMRSGVRLPLRPLALEQPGWTRSGRRRRIPVGQRARYVREGEQEEMSVSAGGDFGWSGFAEARDQDIRRMDEQLFDAKERFWTSLDGGEVLGAYRGLVRDIAHAVASVDLDDDDTQR